MTGNKVCALCGADFHSTVECPWRLMRPAPVALPEWLQDPESFRDRLHEAGYRGDADAQGTGAEAMRLEILAAAPQPPVQQAEPAPAQDELLVVAWRYGFGGGVVRDDAALPEWKESGEYQPLVLKADAEAAIAAARPAQTEQQPVAWRYKCRDSDAVHVSSVQWTSQSWPADWDETPLYAAPIAQTEQQPVAWADAQQLKALVRDCSASCAVWNSQGRSRVPLYATPIAQTAPAQPEQSGHAGAFRLLVAACNRIEADGEELEGPDGATVGVCMSSWEEFNDALDAALAHQHEQEKGDE